MNKFSKRQPYTEERRIKQRAILAKARLARSTQVKSHIKTLTNRQLSKKLQEMGNGPTNTDDTITDTIDVLHYDLLETNDTINDMKLQLDDNTHEEEISILSDELTDLKSQVAQLRELVGGLDDSMEYNEGRIDTLVEMANG